MESLESLGCIENALDEDGVVVIEKLRDLVKNKTENAGGKGTGKEKGGKKGKRWSMQPAAHNDPLVMISNGNNKLK